MFGVGRETPLRTAARVNRHLLPFIVNFYQAFAGLDLHLLLDQCVRDGVEMLLKGDVVINIHLGRLPNCELIGFFRQWTQLGLVDFCEQLLPRLAKVGHDFLIECFDQFLHSPIGLLQAEKSAVP